MLGGPRNSDYIRKYPHRYQEMKQTKPKDRTRDTTQEQKKEEKQNDPLGKEREETVTTHAIRVELRQQQKPASTTAEPHPARMRTQTHQKVRGRHETERKEKTDNNKQANTDHYNATDRQKEDSGETRHTETICKPLTSTTTSKIIKGTTNGGSGKGQRAEPKRIQMENTRKGTNRQWGKETSRKPQEEIGPSPTAAESQQSKARK